MTEIAQENLDNSRDRQAPDVNANAENVINAIEQNGGSEETADFIRTELSKKQQLLADKLQKLQQQVEKFLADLFTLTEFYSGAPVPRGSFGRLSTSEEQLVPASDTSQSPETTAELERFQESLDRFIVYAAPEIREWTQKYAGKTGYNEALRQGYIRSGEYYSSIQKQFAEAGVPLSLVDFGFVESHWKSGIEHPTSAAVGVFQFIAETARNYGLIVDQHRNIDERRDPEKIGGIAGTYLRDLHEKYKSSPDAWLWALADYNGAGNDINGLDKRTGAKIKKGYFEQFGGDFRKYIEYNRARFFSAKKYITQHSGEENTEEYKKQQRFMFIFEERLHYIARFAAIRTALYEGIPGVSPIVERAERKEAIHSELVTIASKSQGVDIDNKYYMFFDSPPNISQVAKNLGISVQELYTLNPAIITSVSRGNAVSKVKVPFGFRLRIPSRNTSAA